MMLAIFTQYAENYGTTAQPYWKFKGGSTYKVLNVPENMERLDLLVSAAGVEVSDDYCFETVLGYEMKPDDYLSEFEQSQLEYDGKIICPEPTMDYSDIVNRIISELTVAETV